MGPENPAPGTRSAPDRGAVIARNELRVSAGRSEYSRAESYFLSYFSHDENDCGRRMHRTTLTHRPRTVENFPSSNLDEARNWLPAYPAKAIGVER